MIQPRVVGQKRLPHGAVLGKVPSSQPGGARPAPRHGGGGEGLFAPWDAGSLAGLQHKQLYRETRACSSPLAAAQAPGLGSCTCKKKTKKQDPLVGDAATDAPPQRLARRGGEGLENHEGLGFAPSAALPGGEWRQSLAVRCRRAPPRLPFGFWVLGSPLQQLGSLQALRAGEWGLRGALGGLGEPPEMLWVTPNLLEEVGEVVLGWDPGANTQANI